MKIRKENIFQKGCALSEEDVSRKSLLQGEIDGVETFFIEVLKDRPFQFKPEKKSASIFLLFSGIGRIQGNDTRFDVSELSVFVPSAQEIVTFIGRSGKIDMLEIRIRLLISDASFIKKQQNQYPFFSTRSQARHYTEPIKSGKTINRMLLPENIVPRFCIGLVETTGPDQVGAHSHPMLEQLYFGLKHNCCIVSADGLETVFEENDLLHIPLGSEHAVRVDDGKILKYIWIDFFRSQEEVDYITKTHIISANNH